MKKIMITGARGFVGRSLTEYFRSKPGSFETLAYGRGDLSLLDGDAVLETVRREKPDVIVNCASEGGSRKSGYTDGDAVLAHNLRMFFNLERALPEGSLLINFGSGAQYDKSRDLIKIRESSLGERIPSDPYGFGKYVLSGYAERSDNILAPVIFGLFGEHEDYTYKFISNACVKNMLGMDITINQDVRFDYLYIGDFVRIIERLALRPELISHNVFNLTPNDSLTLTEAAGYINDIGVNRSNITVRNPGMNFEYTGDNSRLLENLGGSFDFTPAREAIKDLYEKLYARLDSLDTDAVKRDSAAAFCVTKQTTKKPEEKLSGN
ncbi:MAG: NAD(P)-dependent oxidoreductase [Clostridia bacterium]|nr:NAD(P)-dependent oxidoreductase [Clostridia bacterium]